MRSPTARSLLSIIAAIAFLQGCSDDDDGTVGHSGDIAINQNLSQGDVVAGALANEKNITTESGNPCGKFINDAETVLGRPPSSIRVDEVMIELTIGDVGITGLSSLWDGVVTVSFVTPLMAVPVAEGPVDASTGPILLPVTAIPSDFDPVIDDIVACNYAVRVSGNAAAGLPGTFNATVAVTVNLSALP